MRLSSTIKTTNTIFISFWVTWANNNSLCYLKITLRTATNRNTSHYRTATLTLSSFLRCRRNGRLADIFKCRPYQLARHCRAFDIPICPHLLGHSIGVLRIYNTIWIILRPQVSLQPHYYHRQRVSARKRLFDLVDPLIAIT